MKTGFVSLIGLPNAGKSTIINLLSNSKISIVTPKAQTTRDNVISIIENNDYQIVILDTPGLHNAKNSLGKSMNKKISEALISSDILILVIDAKDEIFTKNLSLFLKQKIDIVVINKIDLININEAKNINQKVSELFPKSKIIEMCAKDGFNKDELLNSIVSNLKEGPKYYPNKDAVKDDNFYTKEIIREKILTLLKDEVPHNIAVNVKSIKHKKESCLITAQIIVNKESQKGIVIGKNGQMIKKIGQRAREDLEKYYNKNLFLNLMVKVKKDWIDTTKDLKELGY